MSQLFDVSVRTDAAGLARICQGLDGSSRLLDVKMANGGNTASPRQTKPRGEGPTGAELAIKTLTEANRPMSSMEMVNTFVKHGFAGGSAHSILSKLHHDRKIRYLGDRMYCAYGVTVKQGASVVEASSV